MKKLLLLPLCLSLASCETFAELDWFGAHSKKIEGNRISAFSDENLINNELILANIPTLDLGNITSLKLATSAKHIYFNNHYAYYLNGKNFVKLDVKNGESKQIFRIPNNTKVDRIIYADDEEIIISDSINIIAFNLYNHTSKVIYTEVPVKSDIVKIDHNTKCFQDISLNLKCFNNDGIFTLLFEDIASDIVAKSQSTISHMTFFSSKDGVVRAIDVKTRNLLWEYNSAHKFDSLGQSFYNLSFGPQTFGSTLVFANYATGIFGIDLTTGVEKFRNPARELISAASVAGYLIANGSSGNILIIDQATGKSFKTQLNMPKSEKLRFTYVHNGKALLFTSKGKIITINLTTTPSYDKSNVIVDLKQEVLDVKVLDNKIILRTKNKLLIINKK